MFTPMNPQNHKAIQLTSSYPEKVSEPKLRTQSTRGSNPEAETSEPPPPPPLRVQDSPQLSFERADAGAAVLPARFQPGFRSRQGTLSARWNVICSELAPKGLVRGNILNPMYLCIYSFIYLLVCLFANHTPEIPSPKPKTPDPKQG